MSPRRSAPAAAARAASMNNGRLFVELKPKDQRPALGARCWPTCVASSPPYPGINSLHGRRCRTSTSARALVQEPVPASSMQSIDQAARDRLVGAGCSPTRCSRDGRGLRRRHHRPAPNKALLATLVDRPRQGGESLGIQRRRAALHASIPASAPRQISTIYTTGRQLPGHHRARTTDIHWSNDRSASRSASASALRAAASCRSAPSPGSSAPPARSPSTSSASSPPSPSPTVPPPLTPPLKGEGNFAAAMPSEIVTDSCLAQQRQDPPPP
jgi:hypothetical protein